MSQPWSSHFPFFAGKVDDGAILSSAAVVKSLRTPICIWDASSVRPRISTLLSLGQKLAMNRNHDISRAKAAMQVMLSFARDQAPKIYYVKDRWMVGTDLPAVT